MVIWTLLLAACAPDVGPETRGDGSDILAPAKIAAGENAFIFQNYREWQIEVTYRAYDAGNDELGNGYTFLCTDAESCNETLWLSQESGVFDLGTAGEFEATKVVESSSGAVGYWNLAPNEDCWWPEKQLTIVWMAQQDGPDGPDGIVESYPQDYFNSYFHACLLVYHGASFYPSPDGESCSNCGWDEPWWSINEVPEYPWLYSPGYAGSWGGRITRLWD